MGLRDFFKVFIEFVIILLLFYVLVFWPRGTWDLSSLNRDSTCIPCIGRWNINHCTAREVSLRLSGRNLTQSFQSFLTVDMLGNDHMWKTPNGEPSHDTSIFSCNPYDPWGPRNTLQWGLLWFYDRDDIKKVWCGYPGVVTTYLCVLSPNKPQASVVIWACLQAMILHLKDQEFISTLNWVRVNQGAETAVHMWWHLTKKDFLFMLFTVLNFLCQTFLNVIKGWVSM